MTQSVEHIAGAGFLESFVQRYPMPVLETLLCDRSAGRNIIWADNEYEALGEGYRGDDEITVEKITGLASGVIKPRIAKAQEKQSQRTKSRAEVFTPSWLCNQMNNDIDAEWFGRRDVFNTETADGGGVKSWKATVEPIEFPKTKGRGWRGYVNATRLEITCGEAPFVCSRYDTVTGEPLPVRERIGFLDRKLRVVSENAKSRAAWSNAALEALQATYGYEYQGDNLLIARINVFETFMEHLRDRWQDRPAAEELEQVALVVSWNFWQMDGFTDAVPTSEVEVAAESPLGEQSALFEMPEPEQVQMSLFDLIDEPEQDVAEEAAPKVTVPLCVLYDWSKCEPFEFAALKGEACSMGKKFYAVIGNPPYQEEKEDNARKPPIYHYFMDASYQVSERTELITPARFLFNAGQTPKEWNRKMLSDTHLKVLDYTLDGSAVFQGTDIKGGVAVTYRNELKEFEPIQVFIPYKELKGVIAKLQAVGFTPVSDEVTGAVPYRFSETAQNEHPELIEKMGKSLDLRTNVLDKLQGELFFDKPMDDCPYAAIYGLVNKRRDCLWIKRSYIDVPDNFSGFKVLLPKASGSGNYGERLAEMLVASKGVGHTQSFVSIGNFDTEDEADCFCKYIKGKFSRSLLGVYKVTQDITPRVWTFVPMQDFTPSSDIDWSKSIPEIDQQLYAKYGLDENEIEFIETHVKEMS